MRSISRAISTARVAPTAAKPASHRICRRKPRGIEAFSTVLCGKKFRCRHSFSLTSWTPHPSAPQTGQTNRLPRAKPMCRSSCFWSGSNSDRNTIHGEERPSAAWKSSVSRIPPNYAIRQSAKPRNPPVVHPTHTKQRGAPRFDHLFDPPDLAHSLSDSGIIPGSTKLDIFRRYHVHRVRMRLILAARALGFDLAEGISQRSRFLAHILLDKHVSCVNASIQDTTGTTRRARSTPLTTTSRLEPPPGRVPRLDSRFRGNDTAAPGRPLDLAAVLR